MKPLSAVLISFCLLQGFSPARAEDNFLAPASATGAGGRFLLLERPDPQTILNTMQADTAPVQGSALENMENDLPLSDYSQGDWNRVREDIETGGARQNYIPETDFSLSTSAPSAPPPEVEFKDSGTSLSVTGRKVISLNYSGKRFINDQKTVTRPRSLSLFEITQQMQVRMQGKVGQKISVNVDYDDTKQDKQDISVVYQGEPNEVVQNVSFGDIDLSLPATEFVSYNKQLFGIRADLQTNHFKMTFVGSRTKGLTKTKQFTGNTQFQGVDLLDTNYLRRKYYDVAFRDSAGNAALGRLPIKAGSEKIYIDQQNQTPVDNITVFDKTANDLDVPASSYTGRFQLLNPGIDYVMDYVKGIVTFNRTLNSQDVVIIDYINANGSSLVQNSTSSLADTSVVNGLYKLIKNPSDIYISQAGDKRELKTYYSIGQTNIVHDDGRGNFTLKVKDQNRNDVGTSLNPTQTYPDDMDVDFDQGIITLKHPFGTSAADPAPDKQIYSDSPSSKRLIRVEYYYRFKTFLLEPSIVLQSESVLVDGVKLTRNQDYFIDYDSGFITFYYPDRITQNSKIDLTYEVAPFGGLGNQSLAGGRISYDLSRHLSLGSTLLYQGGIKSASVPNVADLTNSMTVYEGDAQLKDLNILGLKMNLSGELAQSKTNPNLNDYALIDNMEGVKQEDSPSFDKNYWFIAANPMLGPADPNALKPDWNSEDVKARDINSQATSDGTQQVLTVHYDFNVSSEVSIVYPLSATGLDFSQKTSLELVLYGENSDSAGNQGPELNIHFGQINEDADGTGGIGHTLTCASGLTLPSDSPKSEDLNCDGQVSSAEDIGWLYAPPGRAQARYGGNNGRLDSEDLNKNGRLDAQDFTGGDFGYVSASLFRDTTDLLSKNKVNFSGWRTLQAPMPIASTDSYKWSDIKQVRLSLTQTPGGATRGVIKIARLAAVGNTWTVQPSATVGSLQTLAVNNIDNPGYIPIYSAGGDATTVFNELYGSVSDQQNANNSKNLVEQALSITYSDIASTSTAYVYRKFTRPIDISQHKQFRLLLKPQALDNGASFYLQLGDENNYFRAEVPLDTSHTGWRLITLDQVDLTGDNVPDVWDGSNYNITVSSKGTPSLQQVSQIVLGIKTADGSSHSGTVYIDEIHLAKSITRTGNARKVEGNFEVPGWMSFGGKYRYVDRGFQTPVSAITNQDNEQDTGYLNFTRFSFFPMNFTAGQQLTVTPNTLATGSNNLVNSLQQGKVKALNGTAAGTLNIPALPKLGLNYSKNITDYSLLSRRDDRDLYTASLSYPVPVRFFPLPKSLDLNYSFGRSQVNYDASKLINTAGLFGTDEITNNYGAKLAFVPWNGSSLNPGYTLQQVKEKRTTLSLPGTEENYPKSRQQTVDFNSNFQIVKWFNPSVNYSVTTMENNNLTVSTLTMVSALGVSSKPFNAGDIKTVTRNAQGGVSLTLNANDLVPSNKLLRSMVLSSNYQIQDGDSWQNVEKEYDTSSKLWLRSALRPQNPFAQRNSITLRDTVNSTQRWQPFEGFAFKGAASALNTMSLTNNFTNSVQRSEVTGTISKSVTRTFPDLIVSLSQLEALLRARKWAQNATINLKYSHNKNESVNISLADADTYGMDMRFKLLNYMDTALSYNLRTADTKDLHAGKLVQSSVHNDATLQGTLDYKKFRFTPKVDYVSDVAKGALGVVNQNTVTLTPSLLIKTDLQIPKGLKLPFFKDTMVLTNRIVWTTTLSYAIKTSPITIADNNRLFSLNSSADYELATNLRMTFNLGLQRLWHKYLKEEEYLSYQAGSTMTFQF
ncbi:MAG: hypothetical protein NTX59_14245 [Elusimicrobia bacterium]|nr:hypothetical protein [Elusimicrobiota bacterium]